MQIDSGTHFENKHKIKCKTCLKCTEESIECYTTTEECFGLNNANSFSTGSRKVKVESFLVSILNVEV